MNNFTFHNPTKIIFGKDTIRELGPNLAKDGHKKVLLHYGQSSIFKNGVYDAVIKSLEEEGIIYLELGGVLPNPRLSKVKEGIDICKKEEIHAILPLGGGSVYDSAKAMAAGALYEGDVWDFYEKTSFPKEALPLYGVLTLSATGSEMNSGCVVTKEEENKKWAMGAPCLYPKVSIIDPTVQFGLPRHQTVNGAVDVITHVLELYFDGTKDVTLMEEYSEALIRTIIRETPTLLEKPDDYSARSQFAWAATLALNMSTTTGRSGGDWASHGMEHSLSAFYDISHGAGLSIIFPAWAKYVYKEDLATFARFSEKIFDITEGSEEERALAGIHALEDFYRKIGSPVRLQEANIPVKDLDKIADNAALIAPMGRLKRLEREDILAILKLAAQ